MADDMWTTIYAERKALAADLTGLDEGRWSTPSLCASWTVRDVLAHMTATAKTSAPSFFANLLKSGFSFTKLQEKEIAEERGATAQDTLDAFESVQDSTKHPPGPPLTWLGE